MCSRQVSASALLRGTDFEGGADWVPSKNDKGRTKQSVKHSLLRNKKSLRLIRHAVRGYSRRFRSGDRVTNPFCNASHIQSYGTG
jgi:hypothetical protein